MATPKTKMSLEDARARLAEELSPFLVVLGARRGSPEMTFREASWRLEDEFREDGTRLARIGLQRYVSMTTDAIIAPPASYGDELAKEAEWVAADPVYGDLLGRVGRAKAAPNPRPEVYKLIERLERRFGSRPKALLALGLPKKYVDPAVSDQSKFKGDRHAKHGGWSERPQIDDATRQQVLDIADGLVQAYEDKFLV